MRALDLDRRDVALKLDLFEPAFGGRDVPLIFLLVVGLDPLAVQLLRILLDLALAGAHLAPRRSDGVNEPLPRALLQLQVRDLAREAQTYAGDLALQAQKFLARLLAARGLLLGA